MKNSIKVLIAAMVICVQGTRLQAQSTNKTTGIYITEQDFKTGKLSYTLGAGDKLLLNEFLNGKNITIISQGQKTKLAKSQMFGYCQNGQSYRFYRGEAYCVLDTAGFILYSCEQLIPQGKGLKPVEKYFYSVNITAPVLSLTMANIDESFAGETGFRYSVNSLFEQDGNLVTYDKANRQYMIKYLYQEYKHNAAAQHAAL
ncbi:hypothetical protein [Mucilaginibacter dorajii]|uniref:Uncharacterized protein n=1 Tax=Mucilaginibacter dorajii TaxID=692994 RepID=A0ABP7QI73_9SPHI|nr:hypothetical protein [Mucilaginibacter dorajii]MCS3736174.1 hypothetical protein [Mucilaginibacter dorajii]